MKIILISIIAFSLVSCGQASQRQSANVVLENSDTLTLRQDYLHNLDSLVLLPPASEIDSLAMILIAEAIQIPVGNSLLLSTFEKKWYRWGNEKESDNDKWLTDLNVHFAWQYNFYENSATMIDKKYFRPLFNITPCLPNISRRKGVLNEQFKAIAIDVVKYQDFKLYSFLTEDTELECINCEYGESTQIQSLVSIFNGRIIDNLIVAYTFSDGIGASSQFFYYDDSGIIHIKQFGEDDDGWNVFAGYQKYQITPHGRFIRYYEQNGIFENDNEQGLVQNHTREGKWVDMSNTFYIEAEYKDGLPVGKWHYYQMLRDFTEEGFVILPSRRKGELLYTETYENGRLVSREIISDKVKFNSEFFD
ncbi:MAG: G5 domain-containing protein [Dysgonamonadaceae bacterium]|nr:G5 domain-containing protein [Dysgonamonadaceae bacterium]